MLASTWPCATPEPIDTSGVPLKANSEIKERPWSRINRVGLSGTSSILVTIPWLGAIKGTTVSIGLCSVSGGKDSAAIVKAVARREVKRIRSICVVIASKGWSMAARNGRLGSAEFRKSSADNARGQVGCATKILARFGCAS